jgi:hypothetical protein
MSKESRRRLRDATQTHLRTRAKQRFQNTAVILSVLVCLGSLLVWWKRSHAKPASVSQPSNSVASSGSVPPKDLNELCQLTTNQLAQCDIALMNLLCAERLPGAEDLNIPECLERLDGIARHVKAETDRHLYKFRERPGEYENSEGYFRIMMMVTVLQQDLGIRYNPKRISLLFAEPEPTEKFFADPKDIFIHGLIKEKGTGTCSSMPVFIVSVGRRLGYPLNLVRAKGHLFARWDEGDRSFNIEGTSVGFVSHPDSYYRNWPFSFTAEEEKTESYLKSLTPSQELATFFNIRGGCCLASSNLTYATGAFEQAFKKEPESVVNQQLAAWSERKAYEAGLLPKRMAIQYALHILEIPSGPMQPQWAAQKAALQARNMLGEDEQQLELDTELLITEIKAYRR